MMSTSGNGKESTEGTGPSWTIGIENFDDEEATCSQTMKVEVMDEELHEFVLVESDDEQQEGEGERSNDKNTLVLVPIVPPSQPPRPHHVRAERSSLARLQRKIKGEEMKMKLKNRIRKFGNPFLEKVQREIKGLQDKNLWQRNVLHAPFCSLLLQEIFSED